MSLPSLYWLAFKTEDMHIRALHSQFAQHKLKQPDLARGSADQVPVANRQRFRFGACTRSNVVVQKQNEPTRPLKVACCSACINSHFTSRYTRHTWPLPSLSDIYSARKLLKAAISVLRYIVTSPQLQALQACQPIEPWEICRVSIRHSVKGQLSQSTQL